ncbi:MAG: acetylxylan esterase [Anaerolineae bacterium]|nr:acetylxylan esterase [Anaerolineae bacterium]
MRDLNSPDLQPAFGLWQRYTPSAAPYAFRAASLAEAEAWQGVTRAALMRTLGFLDLPPALLSPRRLESVDKGDYVREKWLLRTSAWTLMPLYVLIPKQGCPPFPTVLAFNGHGYGVKAIVGLKEDGTDAETADYHQDFAVRLCRRGFLVAAPEISCFGERQTDFSYLDKALGQSEPTTCAHTAMLALHLGGSVAGLRVYDGLRLVDYLETRADADVSRLGAMGISGGGMHTFFSTCVDLRIKACAISGYYSTFKDSILAMHHCSCNFVPGLWQFGEMYDLVGLIAPRPLLVQAGTRDPIFPMAAVQRSVARAREVYAVFDAQDHIEADYFEGGHQIGSQRPYDFLWEQLGRE